MLGFCGLGGALLSWVVDCVLCGLVLRWLVFYRHWILYFSGFGLIVAGFCCFWVRLLGFWGGFLGPVTLRGFGVIWILCRFCCLRVGWVLSSDSGFRAGLLVGWMMCF